VKHQFSIDLVYVVLSLSSLSKNWPMQKNTKIFFKLKRQLKKKKIKNIPHRQIWKEEKDSRTIFM